MENFDSIVIGAGNGGLVGALNLAKSGKKVLLLEKHNIPGGCGTTFIRGRYEFDVGLHTLWGMGTDENKGHLRKIFEELGVYDKIEFIRQDELFSINVLDKLDLSLPFYKEEFIAALQEISPDEKENILKFQELNEAMAKEFHHLYDELGGDINSENFPLLFELGTKPALEVLNEHIKHPMIRMIYLTYLGTLGMPPKIIPYLLFAFTFEVNTGHHVKGGAQSISNALIEEFERCGGTVMYNAEVSKIDVEENHVTGVRLSDGRSFNAKSILCNANKMRTYIDLIDEDKVPEDVFSDLKVSKLGTTVFGVYLGLNCSAEDAGLKHEITFAIDSGGNKDAYGALNYDTDKINGAFVDCHNIDNPEYSEEGTCVLTVLVGQNIESWLDMSPDSYHENKYKLAEKALELIDKFYPNVREHIEEMEISTPLTHMRYLGTPGGQIYAETSNFKDLIVNRLNATSPIKGLYFCGASIILGGFHTTYMSGKAVSSLMLKELEEDNLRAYNFDDLKGIESIREEIRVSRKFNEDHRSYKGTVARVINLYHPKKIKMNVSAIVPESPSSKTIRLSPKDGYLPPFMAGQYINVAVDVGGIITSRAYSISSSPNQRAYYEITVREKNDGFVSNYLLHELKVGDSLETSAPAGQFIYNPLIHGNHLVFIAGGSGITPFMSMVRNFSERNKQKVKVDLIYGCAQRNDVIFRKELEELQEKFEGFNLHLVISEPLEDYEGHTGFISADLISKVVGTVDDKRFYLCGPEEMYQFVVAELLKLGLDEKMIRREVQTSPADPTKLPNWPQDVTAETQVQIKLSDGPVIRVRAIEPILNSLEKHNIIVPSECRAGECSLCRTKLISGNVYYPDTVHLRKADRAYNYIHPCASYPVSDIEIKLQV
ncbi:FAD-dependent oxidoreductase [Thermodesulfobacteriota bacterium]